MKKLGAILSLMGEGGPPQGKDARDLMERKESRFGPNVYQIPNISPDH
jgi:hypothetical protein